MRVIPICKLYAHRTGLDDDVGVVKLEGGYALSILVETDDEIEHEGDVEEELALPRENLVGVLIAAALAPELRSFRVSVLPDELQLVNWIVSPGSTPFPRQTRAKAAIEALHPASPRSPFATAAEHGSTEIIPGVLLTHREGGLYALRRPAGGTLNLSEQELIQILFALLADPALLGMKGFEYYHVAALGSALDQWLTGSAPRHHPAPALSTDVVSSAVPNDRVRDAALSEPAAAPRLSEPLRFPEETVVSIPIGTRIVRRVELPAQPELPSFAAYLVLEPLPPDADTAERVRTLPDDSIIGRGLSTFVAAFAERMRAAGL